MCGLKAAYAGIAFITIDICPSFMQSSECFFFFCFVFLFCYIDIWIHCTSIHTISIRQTFTTPDLILRSVCAHSVHVTTAIAYRAQCNMHWMSDAYKILVKCHVYVCVYEWGVSVGFFSKRFLACIYLLFILSGCILHDKCHTRFNVSFTAQKAV